MTTKTNNKQLAKALHTVTVVARVAAALPTAGQGYTAAELAMQALDVLGYTEEQFDHEGALFLACVAAVAKSA